MTTPKLSLSGITVSLIAFETLVLATLVFFPYVPDSGLASFHASVYALLAPLTTILLLGVLYTWLARLGSKEAARHSIRIKAILHFLAEPFDKTLSSIRNISPIGQAQSLKILSHPRLLLGISIATSILLALIPYRPDLNPTGTLVGLDAQVYTGWIGQTLSMPLPQALQYSFVEGLDGSRPLLLVLLYLAASTGASPSLVIEILPMVLAPLLSLSVYIFVRFGQGSAKLAGLTALFSPVSFYVTVGVWGAYYANWLGLILLYPFLTCLLRFSKSPSSLKFAATFSLSLLLFLTHPWTWILIMSTCLVFAVSLWNETRNVVHVKSVLGITAAGIALDVVKSLAFSTRTLTADLLTKTPGVFDSLLGFWNGLVDALLFTHDGLFGSWILMGLALLGGLALRFKDWFERLLILWVGVASIPFLVLDGYHKARIVYDLPVPVLASVGVLLFVQLAGTRNVRWPGLWIVIVLVLCAAYAVQAMLLL